MLNNQNMTDPGLVSVQLSTSCFSPIPMVLHWAILPSTSQWTVGKVKCHSWLGDGGYYWYLTEARDVNKHLQYMRQSLTTQNYPIKNIKDQ
jgi:hypothetical protein